MDILLVNPLWKKGGYFPRSLFELGSFLMDEGFNVDLCDLNLKLSNTNADYLGKSVDIINSYNCKIICITISVNNAPFALELINKLKEKDITIIAGGLFITPNPKKIFDNCKIDYIILGEGFKSLKYLIEKIQKGNKYIEDKEILCRNSKFNNTYKATESPTIMEFNASNFEKLGLKEYVKTGYWGTYSSKGCHYTCNFCSSNILWKTSRYRKFEEFMGEINYMVSNYSIKNFQFFDDCFTANKEYILSFLDKIKGLNLSWICNARVNELSPQLLKKMAESGCKRIYHGIESPSKVVREFFDKHINLNEAELLTLLKIEKSEGINPICSLIIGYPGETKADLKNTLNFIKKLKENGIESQLNMFIPFDGVELSNKGKYLKKDRLKTFGVSGLYIKDQFEMYPELIDKYAHLNPENKIGIPKNMIPIYKKVIKAYS